MAELGQLESQWQKFDEQKVTVVAVSGLTPSFTRR